MKNEIVYRHSRIPTIMLENLKSDVLHAVNRLLKYPATSLTIILTLAMGIGATTAMFTVANGLIFQVLPYEQNQDLMKLEQLQEKSGVNINFSSKDIEDIQQKLATVTHVAEYHAMTFTLYGYGDPLRVQAGVVSSSYLPMLGVKPILGRLFTQDEEKLGSEPLILLSYEFWENTFHSDSNVIGKLVEMNNQSHKIIGVLEKFPQYPDYNDIYMTPSTCPFRTSEGALSNRNSRWMSIFARKETSENLADVNLELEALSRQLVASFPESFPDQSGAAIRAVSLLDEVSKSTKAYVYILFSTTILLLIIACTNVTNLILSQHAKRQREFAVRASLGASQFRLMQFLLTETIILSLISGVLGLILAWIGVDHLGGYIQNFTNFSSEIRINGRVLTFVCVVALMSGFLSGLLPSIAKIDLVKSLKEGGKSSYTTAGARARSFLLGGQFVLATTLFVGAAMSVKSLDELKNTEKGFSTEGVEIVQLDMNFNVYSTPLLQWMFVKEIKSELESRAFIESVGISETYPLDTVMPNAGELREAISIDNMEYDPNHVFPNAYAKSVTDGYLETIGATKLSGRFFENTDDSNSPLVAIVNRSLAEKLWPGDSAINRVISLDKGKNWQRIVGVVEDIKDRSLSQLESYQIYVPMSQAPKPHIAIIAKLKDQNIDFNDQVTQIVNNIDKRQALSKHESLQEAVDHSILFQLLLADLLIVFAIIALLITISGISGVMNHFVNIRTREIGTRMALGANVFNIFFLILKYIVKIVCFGLFLGLILSFFLNIILSQYLYNLDIYSYSVYFLTAMALCSAAIVTTMFPILKVAFMQPIKALRAL